MTTSTLDAPTLAPVRQTEQDAIAFNLKDFAQEMLESVTRAIRDFLMQCKYAWSAKRLPKAEWENIKQVLGWNSQTATPYIKVWQWISDLKINADNLELLDINTIKSLCCDRYLDVWYQLQSKRMVVGDVRSLMADINKSLKKSKEPPKVFEYQQSKYGEDGDGRVIIRLEDATTGAELERQFKQSGKLSLATFFKELLRRPSIDEQALAQQELDTYIDEQMLELPVDIKAELEKEDRINELTADFRKALNAITELDEDGHKEDSPEMVSAIREKIAIARELRMYGVHPVERSYCTPQ